MWQDDAARYLEWMEKERRAAPATVAAYRRDLTALADWASGYGIHEAAAADGAVLQAYFERLESERMPPRSRARAMAAVRGLYRFLCREGELPDNYAGDLRTPRPQREQARVLSRGELSRLLQAPEEKSRSGARDRAILALLGEAGLKASEAVALTIGDIDLRLDCVRVRGRGGERTAMFGAQAGEALLTYLQRERTRFLPQTGEARLDEREPLFVGETGEALSRQALWQLVRKYGERAGLGRDVTPELLRRTLAGRLLKGGADEERVREMMGYESRVALRRRQPEAEHPLRRAYEKARR